MTNQGGSEQQAQHTRFWEQQWLWWDRIQAPLRPHRSDVQDMERTVARVAGELGATELKALLLGVTPEFAGMAWPQETTLVAVDRSQGMIDNIWPRSVPPGAKAIQGDWLSLPVADTSCDVVIGDGCFSQVSYPDSAQQLARELHRVLKPSGVLALRSFVRPTQADTVGALFEKLRQGQFGSFHIFKWCLNMALQPSLTQGVCLADVWDAVHVQYPDLGKLASERAWSEESVDTIHAYRNSTARFFYPTLDELRGVLRPHFTERQLWYPTYELGERCPHLCFVRH